MVTVAPSNTEGRLISPIAVSCRCKPTSAASRPVRSVPIRLTHAEYRSRFCGLLRRLGAANFWGFPRPRRAQENRLRLRLDPFARLYFASGAVCVNRIGTVRSASKSARRCRTREISCWIASLLMQSPGVLHRDYANSLRLKPPDFATRSIPYPA